MFERRLGVAHDEFRFREIIRVEIAAGPKAGTCSPQCPYTEAYSGFRRTFDRD
jgi:hypothetical protein